MSLSCPDWRKALLYRRWEGRGKQGDCSCNWQWFLIWVISDQIPVTTKPSAVTLTKSFRSLQVSQRMDSFGMGTDFYFVPWKQGWDFPELPCILLQWKEKSSNISLKYKCFTETDHFTVFQVLIMSNKLSARPPAVLMPRGCKPCWASLTRSGHSRL